MAYQFGQVRAELELQANKIGAYDMMIARHARSAGLTIVTNNGREFKRIDGLRVENWLEQA
ncbi:MAG: PIN domain-containing protein [Paraglaciecola sp.]|uniref:PIN domain-containing protein n=1 Tax=Paraglaciecola sp. TaxID=1920173 RepID=UPI003262FF21